MMMRMRRWKFTQKGLLLCTALALVILVGRFTGDASAVFAQKTVDTIENQQEAFAFLTALGYSNEGETILDDLVRIPKKFDEVYLSYNETQKKAGYDLLRYKGKKVNRYGFLIPEGNKTLRATLLVYKGKLIGGDVTVMELGGEIRPLLPRLSGELEKQ